MREKDNDSIQHEYVAEDLLSDVAAYHYGHWLSLKTLALEDLGTFNDILEPSLATTIYLQGLCRGRGEAGVVFTK